MRLLLVGGTGLLGRALTAAAGHAGHAVESVGSADLDLRDPIPRFEADVVVNCAYVRDGPLRWPVTVDGAVALAAACVATDARLIQLSTDLVFAGRDAPYTAADLPDPLTGYGRAKAAMERLVLAAMPTALIVRTSLLWGIVDGPQEDLVRRACAGEPIRFFTNEVRCPIRVDVLADRLLAHVETIDRGTAHRGRAHSGIIHAVGDQSMNRLELAHVIAAEHRWDATALHGAAADGRLMARPGKLVLHNN